MTNVIAQFGGVASELPGLAGLVRQGPTPRRAGQAAFNGVGAVSCGLRGLRRGGLARG